MFRAMAGSGWTVDEAVANVQSQLNRVIRNCVIYEQITQELEDLSYDKTCEKWEMNEEKETHTDVQKGRRSLVNVFPSTYTDHWQ